MCGRAYETYTDEELAARYLSRRPPELPKWEPRYNLAPTQISPVILVREHERRIALLRFGLVPFWAKDVKTASKYSLINARSEEIETKRTYREAFTKRRCIVPVSGFFEWKRETKTSKRPFAIRLRDESIMSLAGVWEHWKSEETKEEIFSFSIITTAANSLMSPIHDRMPVILSRDVEDFWLDPGIKDTAALKKLLVPYSPEKMEAYEISPLVNSPRNNSAQILEPSESSDKLLF